MKQNVEWRSIIIADMCDQWRCCFFVAWIIKGSNEQPTISFYQFSHINVILTSVKKKKKNDFPFRFQHNDRCLLNTSHSVLRIRSNMCISSISIEFNLLILIKTLPEQTWNTRIRSERAHTIWVKRTNWNWCQWKGFSYGIIITDANCQNHQS